MAIARSEPFPEQACPRGICDGSGWILGPEDVARPCECREQRLRRGRSKGVASVIPPRYRGVSFDRPPVSDMARDMETKGAVEAARLYVEELDEHLQNGRGLWLFGDTGTGKTTLAMLIAKAALEAGHTVAIYSVPKLLTRIRRIYDSEPGDMSYSQFFERLTAVDLLVLDDLGAERHTDWVIEQLYSIVNERYEMERSIIASSNPPLTDAERRSTESASPSVETQIGARTFSRLVEICREIPLFGADRRYGRAA
jgi:DNA replication protein DnaC